MRVPKQILVVDDNPTNCEVLQELLEGEDYAVLIATTCDEAMHIARTRRPLIVLLDVMLPDGDGFSLCRQMKAIEAMSDSRIIMVSAKAMPSEQLQGLQAGADAYVSTPFDESELLAAIRHSRHRVALHE